LYPVKQIVKIASDAREKRRTMGNMGPDQHQLRLPHFDIGLEERDWDMADGINESQLLAFRGQAVNQGLCDRS